MITLLETIGPAVWRASWQAAALALVIGLLVRASGERISPRWRYLLWSVVLFRLLVVATPASPWSVFNLVHRDPQTSPPPVVQNEAAATLVADPQAPDSTVQPASNRFVAESEPPRVARAAPVSAPQETGTPAVATPSPPRIASAAPSAPGDLSHASLIMRTLWALWLAGCVVFGLKLLVSTLVLHRRLSACRPVTDAAILKLLEAVRVRLGLKRTPALLVTPELISPCIVGTWRPRIILPEAIVTYSSGEALRHVLAHELAHVGRGDLWVNWLLLAARSLHWFNPVVWWTIREMQSEREAACDELALVALGETDRSAYAATIVELTASLAPSSLAPGLIGLFSSSRRLKARVERLVRSPAVTTLRAPFAAALLLAIALIGLTDAMPAAGKYAPNFAGAKVPDGAKAPDGKTATLRGRCVDHLDSSELSGVTVRLFEVRGSTSPIVETAKTVTDAEGRFEFANIVPPRPRVRVDRLIYLVFAEADDRPLGEGGTWTRLESDPDHREIRMLRDETTLAGTVLDARGRPIAGATVAKWAIDGRPVPGLLSATTGSDGRFEVTRIPDNGKAQLDQESGQGGSTFTISHPSHPGKQLRVNDFPGDVTVALPDGCRVTGTVTDSVTGKPAANAVVLAEGHDPLTETPASTDQAGRFRMVLAEGRYDFFVHASCRACVAITDRECVAGEKMELPPLMLINGGFIVGQVIDAESGNPITQSDSGGPITIGLVGPKQPRGRVIRPTALATADKDGRFVLHAAPGPNFPYFVNTRGNRMAWDTHDQPPVVVTEGETVAYNMLITPPVPPEEKLKAARKVIDSLSAKSSDRTAQIILEFRKLNHTADATVLWSMLIRELVAIGPDAVPQLCAELDRAKEERLLRRLGFTLRAIGDPRAVPALIRALPNALQPSSSDYGLIVADAELMAFMQQHDLSEGAGGPSFDFGRPVREICGALHALTGQNFHDAELFSISLSDDPRRQVQQRRIYVRQAQRWQTWWEAHWQDLTNEAAYRRVGLTVADEPVPPAPRSVGRHARLGDGIAGATLSPAGQAGQNAWHFYDLDTGYRPMWPDRIPQDESLLDEKRLAAWAAENGVDLMCVTHRAADGSQTFVLRAFDMKVSEISPRDVRNLDKLLDDGTLPKGSAVGELLMHVDPASQQPAPDANAAFVFVTREGNRGLIETTDRITRTAAFSGAAVESSGGVGLFKGVQFNARPIISCPTAEKGG